jgi:hypothetical protein
MLAGASFLGAADDATTDEIARLRAALAAQQKQLQALQQAIEQQQQALDHATTAVARPVEHPLAQPSSLGDVASLKPIIPVAPTAAVAIPLPAPQAAATTPANPCEAPANGSPAYLRMGNVCIVPIGFMDLTPFWRDKNAASSMGSNFGSVPYNNVVNGNLSEFHFSEQNSRLGLRVDGDWKGAHFIGYNEFDFNGTSGSSSLAVSNGAIVPRLRLFWVDVRKGKVEFLAGQSWSMMTPNRKGISALPGDLFYSQVIDINYVAGLTWTRQPGVRVLYHPNSKVTFGFSVEQPDQYQGGSAGGSSIVLPAGLTGLTTTQLDSGASIATQNYLAQPGFTPDFIAKVAFDPSSRFHFEVAGIESNFKTAALSAPFITHTTQGGGLMFGANAEIFKNFRVITTNFLTDGDGRYLFGQAPDLVVRADGSLSPVHAYGTVDGFEFTHKNTLMYAYYGADYIGRNTTIDTNGSLVGYGYRGSANSQNRDIQELTFGFNQTIWRDPRYGAINVMGQYEWLMRAPWYVAPGAPKGTHDNTIFFNIRYTLPGGMPNF